MRVGVDANISPKVVKQLSSRFPNDNFQRVGVGPADSDAPWIYAFAEAGGEGLITLDKRIFRHPHEVEALQQSGMKAVLFNFGKMSDFKQQAIQILDYWPHVKSAWPQIEPLSVLRANPYKGTKHPYMEALEYWSDHGKPRLRKHQT